MRKSTHEHQPQLSALLGLALRPLPLLPLELALQGMVRVLAGRHPELCERLHDFEGRCVGIDPSDLPFAIILEPNSGTMALRLVRHLDSGSAAVRIRGSLMTLKGLVVGTYDADALFFSRDIAVEGDVEAAVALRNAIDDAEIDLAREAAACLASMVAAGSLAAWSALAGFAAVIAPRQVAR